MQKLKLSEYIDRSACGTQKHLVRINMKAFQNEDTRPLEILYQPRLFTIAWGFWGNAIKNEMNYKSCNFEESHKSILKNEARKFTSKILNAKSLSMDLLIHCGELEMEYQNFKFNHPFPNKSYLDSYTLNNRKRYEGITPKLPTVEELQKICAKSEEILKFTEVYHILDENQLILGTFTRCLNIPIGALNQYRHLKYDIGISMDINGLESKNYRISDVFGEKFQLKANQIKLSRLPVIYMDFAYLEDLSNEKAFSGPVVFSEYLNYFNFKESNQYLDLMEKTIDDRYFNLLRHILISNFNLASTIEPGNQFSEININDKSFEWHLGSNPNNWHTHRKEVNFFNSDQDSSQIYRLYDIEQTL